MLKTYGLSRLKYCIGHFLKCTAGGDVYYVACVFDTITLYIY